MATAIEEPFLLLQTQLHARAHEPISLERLSSQLLANSGSPRCDGPTEGSYSALGVTGRCEEFLRELSTQIGWVVSMSVFKAFRRSLSRGGSTSAYQTWTDEPEADDAELGQPVAREEGPGEPLKVDCFYLGSQDMTGLPIQGRGCLQLPIEHVWNLTQEGKVRRNSTKQRPHSSGSTEPPKSPPIGEGGVPNLSNIKFVQLQAGPDAITVRDCTTSEVIITFSVRRVATCGRHLAYPKSFAFVARENPGSTPFCHVFKCDDIETCKDLAVAMDKLFLYHLQQKTTAAAARRNRVPSTSSDGTT